MHDTGMKGDVGVAMVTADLLKQGYEVMLPVSAVSPFDVAAYSCGKFIRIQVKYREERKGSVTALLRRSVVRNGRAKHSPLTSEDVDVLAIFCPNTNACYYINRQDVGAGVTLRTKPSGNNQTLGVRFAEDYRLMPDNSVGRVPS